MQAFKFGFFIHFGGCCMQAQPKSKTEIQAYKVAQGIAAQCCPYSLSLASFRL
jgi:hypothetical protein